MENIYKLKCFYERNLKLGNSAIIIVCDESDAGSFCATWDHGMTG